MTGFFTKADYTQSPDSENNPLIMTLPDFSVFSAPALSEQLLRLVVVPAKDAPKRDKAKFLKELPRSLFVPTVHHYTLFKTLDSLIRQGYKNRNPNNVMAKQFMRKAGTTLEAKLQDFGTDYRDGFSATLVGVSGNGKTYSVSNLLRYYPQVIEHYDPEYVPSHFTQVVYLLVNCPDDGSPKSLCTEIIAELSRVTKEPYSENLSTRISTSRLRLQIAQLMNVHKVGLLVIDEIQNLVNLRRNKEELFNFIVTLSNTLNVPLLFIGTPKLMKLLESNLRTDRRLGSQGWLKWDRLEKDSEDWKLFMKHLWNCSVLAGDPNVMPATVNEALYACSQGIVDILIRLFVTTQINALIRMPNNKGQTTVEGIKWTFKESFTNVSEIIRAIANNDLESMSKYEDVRMPEERFTQLLSNKMETVQSQESAPIPEIPPIHDTIIRLLHQMGVAVNVRLDTEIRKLLLANPNIDVPEAMTHILKMEYPTPRESDPQADVCTAKEKPKKTLPSKTQFPITEL